MWILLTQRSKKEKQERLIGLASRFQGTGRQKTNIFKVYVSDMATPPQRPLQRGRQRLPPSRPGLIEAPKERGTFGLIESRDGPCKGAMALEICSRISVLTAYGFGFAAFCAFCVKLRIFKLMELNIRV